MIFFQISLNLNFYNRYISRTLAITSAGVGMNIMTFEFYSCRKTIRKSFELSRVCLDAMVKLVVSFFSKQIENSKYYIEKNIFYSKNVRNQIVNLFYELI